MLPGREEEGSVDERVPVEDVEHRLAEDARHPVHLVGRVAREDEDASLVVADAAFVLHLGQEEQGALVRSSSFLSAAIGIRPRNYLSCSCCCSSGSCSPFGSFPHINEISLKHFSGR